MTTRITILSRNKIHIEHCKHSSNKTQTDTTASFYSTNYDSERQCLMNSRVIIKVYANVNISPDEQHKASDDLIAINYSNNNHFIIILNSTFNKN